ncbi:DUF1801 domain-containing protein [Streptomyces sp. NPDC051940]|uniref:iron chaperone n=1 Tax=Streptomyces sp. NPDC051940 TaxID=3155675 RepID=UPI003432796A
MSRPQTVEEYLDGFTGPGRELLEQLRALVHESVPDVSEAVKWGSPAFLHPSTGTILVMVSGHQKHAGFVVTPSTMAAFAPDLTGFETGKGTVKLPYGEPVPAELLQRMIAFRVREHEDDGVKWM